MKLINVLVSTYSTFMRLTVSGLFSKSTSVLPKGTDSKDVSLEASGGQRRISLLSASSFISFVLKAIIGSKSTVLKETSSLESSDEKKRVGLFSAVTFTLGTIIGCGIFITPAGILRYSGSLGGAMIIWCCSGLISMIGAFVYIELGTTFPQSGSDFIYIQKSLGDLPAFLYIWTSMIVTTPAGMAIQSMTFANYVLEPFFLHCMIPPNAIRMVAGSVICRYILQFFLNILSNILVFSVL